MGNSDKKSLNRSILEFEPNNTNKSLLHPAQGTLPLMIKPRSNKSEDLIDWAKDHRDFIEQSVHQYGGVLFRGFNVEGAEAFERFIATTGQAALTYQEKSSPRSQVAGNIYTSTDHPPNQSIFLHNEQSYNNVFPQKIFFYCMTPAETKGETPIANCRTVWKRLNLPHL